MSAFRNTPVDLRYLSDKDKSDLQRGGGYGQQVTALKRAKAYKGRMAYNANRQQKTTTQTPGTGGFTRGIGLQQERMRLKGQEDRRAESFRPDSPMSSNVYEKLAI